MKVVWSDTEHGLMPSVILKLSGAQLVDWHKCDFEIRLVLGLSDNEDTMSALIKRFLSADDILLSSLAGAEIVTTACCPASAWIFNNTILSIINRRPKYREINDRILPILFARHMISLTEKPRKENGFLKPARLAGYDIIRNSRNYNAFTIRNTQGQKISIRDQFTDQTSYIATQIVTNKILTVEVLEKAGLPVPETDVVHTDHDLLDKFRSRNYRTGVVKPANTDRGVAVYTDISSEEEALLAFKAARIYGPVILQEFIAGYDFRLLVVDGAVIGVTKRIAFHVVGDGRSSVNDLIKEKVDVRSRDEFYKRFNDISPGSAEIQFMLRRQGITLNDIPRLNEVIQLRSNPNVSSGGEHIDVTDECHSDVLKLALECAAVADLDIAGIDYITDDISKSWHDTNGKVCEINPTPALSVPGVPDRVFQRFTKGITRNSDSYGDIAFVSSCECNIVSKVSAMRPDLYYHDLTKVCEEQYFFQTYVTKHNTCCFYKVPLDVFDSRGCVNSNTRTLVFCKKCYPNQNAGDKYLSQYPFIEKTLFL